MASGLSIAERSLFTQINKRQKWCHPVNSSYWMGATIFFLHIKKCSGSRLKLSFSFGQEAYQLNGFLLLQAWRVCWSEKTVPKLIPFSLSLQHFYTVQLVVEITRPQQQFTRCSQTIIISFCTNKAEREKQLIREVITSEIIRRLKMSEKLLFKELKDFILFPLKISYARPHSGRHVSVWCSWIHKYVSILSILTRLSRNS